MKTKVTPQQKRRLFRDLGRGLGLADPKFADKMAPFFEGLFRHYFRVDLEGWENVPESKVLFVGNHNGLLTFEVLMLFHSWRKRFGSSRRALGLAHSIALDNPFFRWIIPRLGAIPADPEVAAEAMNQDYSLLVYPGGERESFRPFSQRKRVDFFGRKGFIRLALKARVPVVPIVSIGAHESYVILHQGEELAQRLGLKQRFRLHGVPITVRSVFFMWCVVSGVFTFFPLLIAPAAFFSIFIPLPAKMSFRVLPPIDVCAMYDEAKSEEDNLSFIYDRVLDTMQRVLTEEYSKRLLPVLG
jgi:1-acyl-sn-glycerol-3-phosphate acyltransferase